MPPEKCDIFLYFLGFTKSHSLTKTMPLFSLKIILFELIDGLIRVGVGGFKCVAQVNRRFEGAAQVLLFQCILKCNCVSVLPCLCLKGLFVRHDLHR